MQQFCIDQILHLQEKNGLEVVINDGEVKGFEKLEVNKNSGHLFYFSYGSRPVHKSTG